MQLLQMSCEKLCKAYILKNEIQPSGEVQTSHGVVKKHLPTIIKQEISYRKQERFHQM